jgi:hypothetical protein
MSNTPDYTCRQECVPVRGYADDWCTLHPFQWNSGNDISKLGGIRAFGGSLYARECPLCHSCRAVYYNNSAARERNIYRPRCSATAALSERQIGQYSSDQEGRRSTENKLLQNLLHMAAKSCSTLQILRQLRGRFRSPLSGKQYTPAIILCANTGQTNVYFPCSGQGRV